MAPRHVLSGLAALTLTFGASAGLAGAAHAAPTDQQKIELNCSMPSFGASADFKYALTADFASSGATNLEASLSDMPGVVPAFISMKDQDVSLELVVTVDGTEVKLLKDGKADVNPSNNNTKEPIVLPKPLVGSPANVTPTSVVEIKSFTFEVAGVGGTCVAPGVEPTVTPTPTPSATPSPSKTPPKTPTEAPAQEGKAATGTVNFACTLSAPFNTKFDYKADIKVSGARATADDTDVVLSAAFSKIPGLAPVPIENGNMRIIVKSKVAGDTVTFNGKSTVSVGPNEVVPVPQLSAEVSTDAVDVDMDMESFRFEFDEMAGLEISADCTAKSGSLSTMTIGVGELDDDGNGGSGSGSGTSTSLPRTGGGDAMPVIGLWALALGVAGAGLLVWLPRQRRSLS